MELTTPYRDALPPLSTEEREALRVSIEQSKGVRNACLATEDGRLLDGHNRLEICPDAPVVAVPNSENWTDEECLAFVFRCNRERRNLSPTQKQEVRRREQKAAIALYEREPKRFTQPVIAQMFGVTQQCVSLWFSDSISSTSTCTIYTPDARVKIPAAHHQIILARCDAGEPQTQIAADYGVTQPLISSIVKRLRREQETSVALPAWSNDGCTVDDLHSLIQEKQTFGTIYADPPWKYGNQGTRAATDNHYETMSVGDITALPIGQLAADYCHLWLWTTNAFLFECPKILDAWGFTYQGIYIWCKPQMGIGNCFRVSHEFVVLAIRGEPRSFRVHDIKSWDVIDRDRHSAKPEKVRLMIQRASPGHYLELFGREAVPGWVVWGNQIRRDLFTQSIRGSVSSFPDTAETAADEPSLFVEEKV